MRIEAYSQVQQIYGAKNLTKTQKQLKIRLQTRFRSPVSVKISRLPKMQWQQPVISGVN